MAEAQRLYRLNELVARDIFGVCKEMAAEAAIFCYRRVYHLLPLWQRNLILGRKDLDTHAHCCL